MNSLKIKFLIFFGFIFCGFLSFAQGTFFLDSNGVTVKCTGCAAGDTGVVGGQLYTAHDNTTINAKPKGASDWNRVVTSLVTDTSSLFSGQTTFNQDISSWDMSNVTNMAQMFFMANIFNNGGSNSINTWDVSNVTTMRQMFSGGDSSGNAIFNQDIGDWDVGNVTDFGGMFKRNSQFNQDISDWNMLSAKGLSGMFDRATSFNNGGVSLNCWDTSNITNFINTFWGASSFNQDIGNWDTSNAGTGSGGEAGHLAMSSMFTAATSFNQDISNWCVSNIFTEPDFFSSNNSPLTESNKPVWGTCPPLGVDDLNQFDI